MAGIRSDPKAPGFRHFILAPIPYVRVGSVRAVYRSQYGEIRSEWKYAADGSWKWRFTIPANTTATVVEPGGEKSECAAGSYEVVVPPAKSSRIAVGSYNIRYMNGDTGTPNAWEERKADLAELLRKMDVDVFGLQEVTPGQTEYLTNALPQYAMVGEHRNADRMSGEASPVFYRKELFDALKAGTFWLSETPDTPGVKGWGAACPRVCSWAWLRNRKTGRTFCFANTHTDHVSALARKEGMLLIVRRMREFAPKGTPVVFTGDHNCRENEEPARAVSALLKNALYVSETPPTGPWRTFTGWKWRDSEVSIADALKLPENIRNARKGSPDADKDKNGGHVWEDCGARIDYVYVSDGVKVKAYATHGDARPGTKLYPSDHFPVTAEVEL